MGSLHTHYLFPTDRAFRPHGAAVVRLIKALTEAGFVAPPGEWGPDDPYSRYGDRPDCRIYDSYEKAGATLVERIPEPIVEPTSLQGRLIAWLGPRPKPITMYFDRGRRLPDPLPSDGGGLFVSKEVVVKWSDLQRRASPFGLRTLRGDNPAEWIEINLLDDFYDFGWSRDFRAECQCGAILNFQNPPEDDARIHRICPLCCTPFQPQDHLVQYEFETLPGPARRGGAISSFAIDIYCSKNWEILGKGDQAKVSPEFLAMCESAIGIKFEEATIFS